VSEQDRAKEQGEGVARNLEQSPREPAVPADPNAPQVNVNVNPPEGQPAEGGQEPAPNVNVEHAEKVDSGD
jgi:hypothetical protein